MSDFNQDQIAFFWVGKTVAAPSLLVKSILYIYKDEPPNIFHLTDQITPEIEGVTATIRQKLSKEIMVARLEAYRNFPYNDKLTFFCDADSLLINKLKLIHLTDDIYLTLRKENAYVNSEGYPEFKNKTLIDVMPFLFGAMAFKNGERFFNDLLEICKKLPFRFHQWYGDQYSLKLYYEKTKFKFSKLDINKYLYITKSEIDVFEIMKLMENDVRVITFKGKGTNRYILSTIKNIFRIKFK